MHGNPITTNVAIFWVAGTKPGDVALNRDLVRGQSKAQNSNRQAHWDKVYQSETPTEVSWFQEHAQRSLDLIAHTGVSTQGQIIDVGGGTSTLVDDLLDRGYTQLSVLDISGVAISRAKMRLGERAKCVEWIEADVTSVQLPDNHYDIWHDRAVFHFLTSPRDRQLYIQAATAALKHRGHLIIATFAEDGPTQCSGLDTVRYSPTALAAQVGSNFRLVGSTKEVHETPFGTQQSFIYCHFIHAQNTLTSSIASTL